MSTDRPSQTSDGPSSGKKKIPMLVWIVAAIFVGWAAVFFLQRSGEEVSPQGGTHPTSAQGEVVAPAAPATPIAPGTPQSSPSGG